MNSHIQILKVWLNYATIAEIQNFRGLFSTGAPCTLVTLFFYLILHIYKAYNL